MSTLVNADDAEAHKITLFSVESTEGMKDYFPATVRVEYRGVANDVEGVFLRNVLEAIPVLLGVVVDASVEERLVHLCRALRLEGLPSVAASVMQLSGQLEVEEFFNTVPLVTEEEVRQRVSTDAAVDWSTLMQVRHEGRVFYFADQLEPDGSINPDCLQYWRILSSQPLRSEWENALWWIGNSGWLGGLAPRDVFREKPALVFDAARQTILQYEV